MDVNHYLFQDEVSGEEFIVGACNLDEAKKIASKNFNEPKYRYEMTELEAMKVAVLMSIKKSRLPW